MRTEQIIFGSVLASIAAGAAASHSVWRWRAGCRAAKNTLAKRILSRVQPASAQSDPGGSKDAGSKLPNASAPVTEHSLEIAKNPTSEPTDSAVPCSEKPPRTAPDEPAYYRCEDRDAIEDSFGISLPDVEDLAAVRGLLPLRKDALEYTIKRLQDVTKAVPSTLNDDQVFALASTDLFVEKAQIALTRRSREAFWWGIACVVLTMAVLIIAACFAGSTLLQQTGNSSRPSVTPPTPLLVFKGFQSVAFSALVYVAVKYLIALARSFLHEATTLRDRRHALRFGRLYIYLTRGQIHLEDLQEAFQWNKETSTSFLDINPQVLSDTLFHRVVDALVRVPSESVKAIAEAATRLKK